MLSLCTNPADKRTLDIACMLCCAQMSQQRGSCNMQLGCHERADVDIISNHPMGLRRVCAYAPVCINSFKGWIGTGEFSCVSVLTVLEKADTLHSFGHAQSTIALCKSCNFIIVCLLSCLGTHLDTCICDTCVIGLHRGEPTAMCRQHDCPCIAGCWQNHRLR